MVLKAVGDVTPDRRFRPDEHIRRRGEYQRAYSLGIRVSGRLATLFVLATGLPVGRLGIAATKRLGGSVQRNRAKRIIREVFRRNKIARGFDLVVVPKREMLDASLTAIETEYRNGIERCLSRASRAAAGRFGKPGREGRARADSQL